MKRRLLIFLGLTIMMVSIVGVLVLPALASRGLERKLVSSLERRGVAFSHSGLDVGWNGKVTMRDVVFEDARRGVDLKAARLVVTPSRSSLWSEGPLLDHVEIKGATIALDLGALQSASSEEKSAADEEPSPSAGLQRILGHIPEVDLRQTDVRVVWGSILSLRCTSITASCEETMV